MLCDGEMSMERKLTDLFDRQRFQQNAKLADVIRDVESRYADGVEDDDLELVSAAGMDAAPAVQEDALLGLHARPDGEEQRKW